jgi:hypothetical protein
LKTTQAPTNDDARNQSSIKHHQPHSHPPKIPNNRLGAKLIKETLPQATTPYVELIAVMAKYSPFAEKAGMPKISEQKPNGSVSKVSKTLLGLKFDLPLLGSELYVLQKLENLNAEQTSKLKETFIRSNHPRFKREFAISRNQPFGKTIDYTTSIKSADCAKMLELIKLVGILLQIKAYLFWKLKTKYPIGRKP